MIATTLALILLSPAPEASPATTVPTAPAAEPDTAEDLADLREALDGSVVSTATKSAVPDHLAPGTVLVITAAEMRALGIDTLDQAINYLGVGMTVQSPIGPNTPSGEFGARGVLVPEDGGNHVLLLVDGHAMNEVWGGWQMLDSGVGLPWDLVDHLEIVLGPGSVLYGTNAMAAVINIITKTPQAFEGFHGFVRAGGSPPVGEGGALRPGGLGYRFGHDERVALGFGHRFRWLGRPAGIEVALQYQGSASPSLRFGPQPLEWDSGNRTSPAGSWGGAAQREVWGTGAAFALHVGDFQLRVLGSSQHVRNIGAYDSDFDDPRVFELVPNGRVDLRHVKSLGSRLNLSSRAYGDYGGYLGRWTDSDRSFCPDDQPGCEFRSDQRAYWAGVEEQLTVDWLRDARLTTLVGADGRARWVSEHSVSRDLGKDGLLATTSQWARLTGAGAIYLQQMYQPVRQLGLNAGARLDLDQNFAGARVSPRGAVSYSPWHLTHFKLVYAEAFRAPGIGELLYRDPPFTIRAGALRPEVVRSLELSLTQQLPGGRGMIQAGGFHSWWRDLIGAAPVSSERFADAVANGELPANADPDLVNQYRNLDKIRVLGGFLRFAAHSPSNVIQAGGSVSLTRAKTLSPGMPARTGLPIMPDVIANLHVVYAPGGFLPTFAVAGFFNAPRTTVEGDSGAFTRPNRVPSSVQGRFTLSGPIPLASGLGYLFWVEGSSAKHAPYLVGQVKSSTNDSFGGELAPVSRLSLMFGLRYDLASWPSRRSRAGKRRR